MVDGIERIIVESQKTKTGKENSYILEGWKWIYRTFVNLWLPYEKEVEKSVERIWWLKKWDLCVVKDDNLVISRNGKEILNYKLKNSLKITNEKDKSVISELGKDKRLALENELSKDHAKIINFLPKNIEKAKIQKLLKDFDDRKEKDNLSLRESDVLRFDNWVFFILRGNVPIFYQSFEKIPLRFWPENDYISTQETFENDEIELVLEDIKKRSEERERADIELVLEELRKRVEDREKLEIAEQIKLIKASAAKQNPQFKKKLQKVKLVLDSKTPKHFNELVKEIYSAVWLNKINIQDIKSLVMFESNFNNNTRSFVWAEWRFQIMPVAYKQVLKHSENFVHLEKIKKTLKSWKLVNNPIKNTIAWLIYLDWVSENFTWKEEKNEWKEIIKKLIDDKKNTRDVISNYLENKWITISQKNFNTLLSKIHNDPYMMNKYLIFRKYNSDSTRNEWEKFEHKNYFWLVVLYLAEYCKKEVNEKAKKTPPIKV